MEGTLGEKRPPSPSIPKRRRRSIIAGDIVFEILTWIPAKSLMRFRCICKAWNDMIRSDYNFIKSHIARSQERDQATRLLFEVQIEKETTRFARNKLEGFPLQLRGPLNYFDPKEIVICSNHCNGLVCLYNHKAIQGFLYNITTGEIKGLPFSLGFKKIWSPPYLPLEEDRDHPDLYLGYDPATEKYKLLRGVYYKSKTSFKILTLGTNKWRRIRDKYPLKCYSSDVIFVNGVLYWICSTYNAIAYFNLTEEKFGTLSPPTKCIDPVNEIGTAMWGRLTVEVHYQDKRCNFIYDEVNKVFTKHDSNPYWEGKKFAFVEAENIEEITEYPQVILATSSLISTQTDLVFCRYQNNMEGTLDEKRPLSPSIPKRRRRSIIAGDMVFEILTWIPAKSLMRFRCICKAWNDMIRSDYNFIKSHIARSGERDQATRLLFEVQIKKETSYFARNNLEVFPLQLTGPLNYFDPKEIVICSNHCNGLVCLYNHKAIQGFLYNITTGEIKALPFSLGFKKVWSPHHPDLYLGYDQVTEKYKLLRGVYYKGKTSFKILTLGTNTWRRIRNKYPFKCYSSSVMFFNGVLYWISSAYNAFAYFNLTEEKFGIFSSPKNCIRPMDEIRTAMWGRLIVQVHYQDKRCNFVFDEVNKVFTKHDSNPYWEKKKFAFVEAENIEEITEYPKVILATSSLISTQRDLVFCNCFRLSHVSRFVENIIPLTFIEL
ncbi:hypothetical protein HAX54_017191 [Datura stramonium]|uniref:F-box domain-containing protein n=1 Tax=Datura stramonium TaxID=4076 RepID=A0ABS8S109_DATST|nr:hypothetical protein [Datura stramonium]